MFKKIGQSSLIIVLLLGIFLVVWQMRNNTAATPVSSTAISGDPVTITRTDGPTLDDNIITRVIIVATRDEICFKDSIRPDDEQAHPLSDERPLYEYIYSGTVPDLSTNATIGFYAYQNSNCEGSIDILLGSIAYDESGPPNNSLPINGNFENGLPGWDIKPRDSGFVSLITNPTSTGQLLKVNVPKDEYFDLSSDFFDVTPGSIFTLTVLANVNPISMGHGEFNVKFGGNFGDFWGPHAILHTFPFEAR